MKHLVANSVLLCFLAGCVSYFPETHDPELLGSRVAHHCKQARYHQAMVELQPAMIAWEKYTERTGRTLEGAAGYLYATTMFNIAEKGDKDWGAILDDPQIPYSYKVNMLFEIAEMRLGKGAAWFPCGSGIVIIPASGRLKSWTEVNEQLKKYIKKAEDH
ncbi:MAG: hypothetical protein KGZ25_08120 [Planctomycetes bacterium]|nr:hypothetical protein [Planctomycetota bacterium]